MFDRHCVFCGRKISECMGFVLVRDFLSAIAGKKDWKEVRELCGHCVLSPETENRLRNLPFTEEVSP